MYNNKDKKRMSTDFKHIYIYVRIDMHLIGYMSKKINNNSTIRLKADD